MSNRKLAVVKGALSGVGYRRGSKNRLEKAVATVTTFPVLAAQRRTIAEPG